MNIFVLFGIYQPKNSSHPKDILLGCFTTKEIAQREFNEYSQKNDFVGYHILERNLDEKAKE